MASHKDDSRFSAEVYRIQMLLAKRKDVPIAPPVRPVFVNPEPLDLLGRLQFFHEDDAFKEAMRLEPPEPPTFLFAHPL